MSIFDRLRNKIWEVCRSTDERYEDICIALDEDLSQYERLYESFSRKLRRGGEE